jgi:SAM-dependent methyltransferase
MNSELISKISKYYGEKICKFGSNARGVDWKDEYSQILRFKELTKIISDDAPITINDLGCGYGALYLYLNQQTSVKVSRYYGYDISEDMLANAKSLINDRAVSFIKSDRILTNADYSLASGVFNVKLDTDTKIWEEFIIDTLFNMNERSTRGFAFNCLTSYVDYKMDHLYYGNPLFFFDFCKKKISKYATLIHDYELYEWTILVRKEV